jgi:hypothetical protein
MLMCLLNRRREFVRGVTQEANKAIRTLDQPQRELSHQLGKQALRLRKELLHLRKQDLQARKAGKLSFLN